jgi:hypothetical protein
LALPAFLLRRFSAIAADRLCQHAKNQEEAAPERSFEDFGFEGTSKFDGVSQLLNRQNRQSPDDDFVTT